MWRFKPFAHKEPTGLEGRLIDVGNLKLNIQSVIAEGGFSCVYLAKDSMNAMKQYALKHIICSDEESLELVKKEIVVMKSLKGHPNIVILHAHAIFDMGRMKEALLAMEFCEKSLVNVLESRGVGYFDEAQVLTIFRDVCNAVFAMHCQNPPIAHRDLKAENLLLSSDGLWKLCDFGSTSTNHKRFEKAEEMGIEEDNIRRHTTPAFRAPEMWDLFRRELINEKVDIWALGCLLFRICYFKNAFDGESKLQILNGNYRIPDLPKYSSFVTDLIRDMLQASPDDRPDITQAWFRVNEQLAAGQQKSLPDRPPEMQSTEGVPRPANWSSAMPRRSPPPPPSSKEQARIPLQPAQRAEVGQLGAFWSTQHAEDAVAAEDKIRPKFDEEPTNNSSVKRDRSPLDSNSLTKNITAARGKNEKDASTDGQKLTKPESLFTCKDEAFNSFVAEFDTNMLGSGNQNNKTNREEALEAEIEQVKAQVKQTNLEKAEITFKFEKLSAICRSQRQEIQELKQALADRTPSPNKDASKNTNTSGFHSPAVQQKEKLQQENSLRASPIPEVKPWQAFAEDPKPQQLHQPKDNSPHSVRTRNDQATKQATSGLNTWGFDADSFTAAPSAYSQKPRPQTDGSSSQRFSQSKVMDDRTSQPAGWAGF